jgi:C4-dicarboxylate transporter DctM subunit|tara:strand:- start:119 stop:1405 length:1287 start_codon:yes stop_codon:yes gene_type:complete
MSLILILLCLVVLLLTGLPIFAGLGLVSIILLFVTEGQISSLGEIVFGKLNIYLLVAIPMFAFMAHVMIKSRAIDDLFKTAHTLVRHLPGGLGVATVLSCTVFAAISGSSVATALTIGSTAIPQMKKFGYKLRDTYGVVAAGGTLGILIPPSGPLILYGVVSETSIGALFIAGLLPGLLLAFVFALYCVLKNLNIEGSKKENRASIAEIVKSLKKSFWALLLPPIVLGGMYFGIFTATEAAGVGAIAALLIATFVYKNFSWQDLFDSARETTQLTAMLFMILASAAIFGHVLTVMGLPSELVASVTEAGVGSIVFILLTMGVIFILGMFLETIAIILVTTPIILPVLESLSINPVWYGILLMINLELALITPPVGMNLFVIKGIAKAPMEDVIFGILPYVFLMLLGLIVVLIFPQLALWLPTTMGYGL